MAAGKRILLSILVRIQFMETVEGVVKLSSETDYAEFFVINFLSRTSTCVYMCSATR